MVRQQQAIVPPWTVGAQAFFVVKADSSHSRRLTNAEITTLLRNRHQLHVNGDVQKRPPSARVASRSPDSCSSEVVFTAMQAERSFYMTRAQRHVARTDIYGRTAGTIHTLISSSSAAIRATRTTELSRYVKPLRQKFACGGFESPTSSMILSATFNCVNATIACAADAFLGAPAG
jgi:hypothetical protein